MDGDGNTIQTNLTKFALQRWH